MFKKIIIFLLTISLLLSAVSCIPASTPENPQSDEAAYKSLLDELQRKLAELQSTYSELNEEASEKISELEAEISKLQKPADTTTKAPATTTSVPKVLYRYKINEGKAIITGIIESNVSITIPSIIDGFEVVGIGESAFSSNTTKSVMISDGIEYIDWFAFSGCGALSSITIPESVTRIGYGAFDGVPSTFTIYCHEGSFAESYAKSFGFAYAFI